MISNPWAAMAAVGCLVALGCGGDERPPSTDVVASGGLTEGGGGAAGGAAQPPAGGSGGAAVPTSTRPAVVELPAATGSDPVRVDELGGNRPSLFVVDDQLVVFYNDRSQNDTIGHAWLRTAAWGTADLEPAAELALGGTWVDLLQEPDRVLALVALGRGVRVLAGTLGGPAWETLETLESATPDRICDGGLRSCFFQGQDGVIDVAVGYESYNAVFGCVSKTTLAWASGGAWEQAADLLDGAVAAALAVEDQRVLVTSHAVSVGAPGTALVAIRGGDTTAEQIRGHDAAVTDDGQLLVVQTYNYASEDHVALLRSPDGAGTFTERIVLHTSAHAIQSPRLSADGDSWFVVWLESPDGEIFGSYHRLQAYVTYSPDAGATWSTPARVSETAADQNLGSVEVTSRGSQAAVAYAVTGEWLAGDFQGVYLGLASY